MEVVGFQEWLGPDKQDKTRGWCRACKKVLKGNKSTMIRHSNTPAHLQNMKIMKEVHSSKEASSVIDQLKFEGTREELVIKLELSLCLGSIERPALDSHEHAASSFERKHTGFEHSEPYFLWTNKGHWAN